MPKYKVGFDGQWQGRFDAQEDALAWGATVAETGRLVFVVRKGLFRPKLIAILPEDRYEEGRCLWKGRAAGAAMPVGIGGG